MFEAWAREERSPCSTTKVDHMTMRAKCLCLLLVQSDGKATTCYLYFEKTIQRASLVGENLKEKRKTSLLLSATLFNRTRDCEIPKRVNNLEASMINVAKIQILFTSSTIIEDLALQSSTKNKSKTRQISAINKLFTETI